MQHVFWTRVKLIFAAASFVWPFLPSPDYASHGSSGLPKCP
jgi:hypothetical protein